MACWLMLPLGPRRRPSPPRPRGGGRQTRVADPHRNRVAPGQISSTTSTARPAETELEQPSADRRLGFVAELLLVLANRHDDATRPLAQLRKADGGFGRVRVHGPDPESRLNENQLQLEAPPTSQPSGVLTFYISTSAKDRRTGPTAVARAIDSRAGPVWSRPPLESAHDLSPTRGADGGRRADGAAAVVRLEPGDRSLESIPGRYRRRATAVSATASREFAALSSALTAAGVEVHVIDDRALPRCPDAVFPNNWVSFHADGTVVLYPMLAPNRRLERRRTGCTSSSSGRLSRCRLLDLTHDEPGRFLEGTGSVVFDHAARIAYRVSLAAHATRSARGALRRDRLSSHACSSRPIRGRADLSHQRAARGRPPRRGRLRRGDRRRRSGARARSISRPAARCSRSIRAAACFRRQHARARG